MIFCYKHDGETCSLVFLVPQPHCNGNNLSCLVANKPRGKINKQKTTKAKKRQYAVKSKKDKRKKRHLGQ